MDTDETATKPVIITDGKSHSKMFFKMVCIGLGIGLLIVLATVAKSVSIPIFPKMETAAVPNDDRMLAECDQLIKSGKLADARMLLEKIEDARGLTPEMSEKLDAIYTMEAKYSITMGAKKEAIELLKKIPAESSLYVNAQATIQRLTAPPKAVTKVNTKAKSRSTAHGKHHK